MNYIPCAHCHLPSNDAIIEGDLRFCCKGCQGVYHLLQDNGLGSFYDKLGSKTIAVPITEFDDALRFDSPAFAQKYLKPLPNGLAEISLIITGIHCAACVWLNEKILTKTDGIIEASVNFTNYKARVIFDPAKIKPSDIALKVRSIGYDAKPYDSHAQELSAGRARKDFYYRMIVGVFASMNIMWIALALYLGYFGTIEQSHKNVLHLAEFMLASLALFYSGWPFFKGAYYAARNGFVTMDTLVASGASLAYLYSCYAAIIEHGEVYFDSVTMIITFVLIGKFLETITKKKAVDTLDTISAMAPVEAIILRAGQEISVKLDEVEIGSTVVLRAGDMAPVDGVLTTGEASFDESSLTGESVPVYKTIGAPIKSSSICLDGKILYEATKTFANSHIGVLSKLLEDAIAKKPKIETLANQLSRYFSATILSIGILTFIGWSLSGASFEDALMIAISVIIIACPCALALATPIACIVGLSVGAKCGVIFKSSKALEVLSSAKILFMDKTGTITQGKLQVVNAILYPNFNTSMSFGVLNASNHPVAKSIKEFSSFIDEKKPISVEEISGKGVIAKFDNNDVIVGGSHTLMSELDIIVPAPIDGLSSFYLARNGEVCAHYALKDVPRADAKEAIAKIIKLNVTPVMLTGDLNSAASEIANAVGIVKFYAGCLPQDKLNIVKKAQNEKIVTAFIGDGINDAPALALADASIAMPGAAEASAISADLILLKPVLMSLVKAFEIARATDRTIKQNIAISLIYNAITIPLAISGIIIPLVAAASMSFSSLLVVINSLRLNRLSNG